METNKTKFHAVIILKKKKKEKSHAETKGKNKGSKQGCKLFLAFQG